MKKFKVYHHPTLGDKAVKVGFSWPAFFFGFIWMLIKKLWGFAALWFFLYFTFNIVQIATDQLSYAPGFQLLMYLFLTLGYITLLLLPGFKGNQWCINKLNKLGYDLVGEVEAETPDSAIANIAKSSN